MTHLTILSVQLLLFLIINSISGTKYDNLRKSLALEVFRQNSMKNIMVSPFLVKFPLCKLASVAQESAKFELLSILGMQSNATLQNCYTTFHKVTSLFPDVDLIILNKVILNYTNDINPKFMNTSIDYGVKIDKVGFNYPRLAVSFLNRWADRTSIKRITDILAPDDINNETSILAVSGAHFKITWETPFEIKLTKHMKFHHQNGNTSMVQMMTKAETIPYVNDHVTDAQYVNMKLACYGLSITIAVPSSFRDLPRLINKLTSEPDILNGIYGRMRNEHIKVKLPRFKIKTNIELNEYLQKIGVTEIFNKTNSGLNGILNKNSQIKYMYMSKVKQKIIIDVDEVGIFRQPVRLRYDKFYHPFHQEMNGALEVIADHPFFFVINVHTNRYNFQNLHQLFTGVYYGPE